MGKAFASYRDPRAVQKAAYPVDDLKRTTYSNEFIDYLKYRPTDTNIRRGTAKEIILTISFFRTQTGWDPTITADNSAQKGEDTLRESLVVTPFGYPR